MRLIKPEDFKNVLPYIKLSSVEIKEQIKEHKLVFSSVRNDTVEWKLQLPMFARPFYVYVYLNNKVPTQEEFFRFYVKQNQEYFNSNGFNDEILTGIKARVFRAMPSLVRDLCFNKYVDENIENYKALYSLDLDIKEGIDLLLYNEKNIYGVNLYTDTKRAYDGREHKKNRHILFDNVKYIEFPVKFGVSHKVGDYFLYGENEYNNLLKLIEP